MSINYQEAVAAQTKAEQKAQQDELNARAWHAILDKYTLVDNQANFHIIREWSNGQITVQAFETLLRDNPGMVNMSSREAIIDDIVSNSHGDSNTLRNLKVRLSTFSLAQLRAKRRDIEFKSEVHTRDAAKNFVASQRDTEIGWRGTGYPKLQSTLVPPGQVQATPTGQYLRQLAKTDLYNFKRMVRVYGSAQCDWWMQNGV